MSLKPVGLTLAAERDLVKVMRETGVRHIQDYQTVFHKGLMQLSYNDQTDLIMHKTCALEHVGWDDSQIEQLKRTRAFGFFHGVEARSASLSYAFIGVLSQHVVFAVDNDIGGLMLAKTLLEMPRETALKWLVGT